MLRDPREVVAGRALRLAVRRQPSDPQDTGASVVEYALLVALLVLVCVLALEVLGDSTGDNLSRSGSSIFG